MQDNTGTSAVRGVLASAFVFAHAYDSDRAAEVEYQRFVRWSRQNRCEVSFWRGFAPEDDEWWVVVVEDGGDEGLRGFQWHGRPIALPLAVALAFIERRMEWLRARQAHGQTGPASEMTRYGAAVAPRLNENGFWEVPPPGRG